MSTLVTPVAEDEDDRPYILENTVTSIILNPLNSLQLIVGSLDGFVRIWDYLEGQIIRTLDIGFPVSYVAAHASQPSYIFVGTQGENAIRKAQEEEKEAQNALISSSDAVLPC